MALDSNFVIPLAQHGVGSAQVCPCENGAGIHLAFASPAADFETGWDAYLKSDYATAQRLARECVERNYKGC